MPVRSYVARRINVRQSARGVGLNPSFSKRFNMKRSSGDCTQASSFTIGGVGLAILLSDQNSRALAKSIFSTFTATAWPSRGSGAPI